MSSGLLPPPGGGEHLCGFLLRDDKEEEDERRREVGCQWESPQEEEGERRKEVGCQSEAAERRDAAVQVDLLNQQLSWSQTGSSSMLLQCFAVRPDGPDGGALLQHCTRTRSIKRPASRSPRRPQNSNGAKQGRSTRRYRLVSPVNDVQQEEEEEEEEEEEGGGGDEEEEDRGDPTWNPPEGAVNCNPSAAALEKIQLDSDSHDAPVCSVKLEPDSTVCDVCGKVMKNKSSLARHSFIHTGRKPFSCHLCDLRFNRRDNLQHHLTRLHPEGVARREKQRPVQSWLCAACGKTFSCRSRLKTHEVIHSGVKPHRCDLCPKAYMRTNDLEHHKKVAHVRGVAESTPPSSLLCDLCGKEFKCRSQLAVHFQTHTGERPHLCDICGRKFGRQYQLKRHKALVHGRQSQGGEGPPPDGVLSCSVCGKRLKTEALLAAHASSHSGNKPHRCGICLRAFQRATCLKQHHLRIHLRVKGHDSPLAAGRQRSVAPSQAFSCPICGKPFKFKSLLASHSLIHSDDRPYGCDFCSRSFRRLSHLKRHREVVHANGERPPQSFVCHICGKDKKCRSQLARHVIIHSGERPFACDLCAARFNRSGNLQQHRKRMHGVGAVPAEEAPPILFEEDMTPALTYKQEETVAAVDDIEVVTERAQSADL